MRRKPPLLTAIAGLLLGNTVTALSPDVTVSLVSRFVAGAMSGIVWGLFVGFGAAAPVLSFVGRRTAFTGPDRAGV